MEVEEVAEAVEIECHEMHPIASTAAHQGSFMSTISATSCTISYTSSAKVYLYALLLVTCVPFAAGAAFTSIFIEHGNISGAVFAFFTMALSFGPISIFVMHLFGKVEKYHDPATLNGLKVLSMIISGATGVALGVFIILAFLNKESFQIKGDNHYSAAVFGGLCLATCLELYIVAQYYHNALLLNKSITTHAVPSTTRRN